MQSLTDVVGDAAAWEVILHPSSLPSLLTIGLFAAVVFHGWRAGARHAPPPSPLNCGFSQGAMDIALAPLFRRIGDIEARVSALPGATHSATQAAPERPAQERKGF